MDLLTFVSGTCIVITVLSFAAGIPPCLDIHKRRSTQNVPFLPFLVGLVNNYAILYYGFLRWDVTILIVNTIGSVIQTAYVLVYLRYAERKGHTYMQLLYGGLFLAATYLYLHYIVVDRATLTDRLGLITCVTVVLFNIAPLAELVDIVKTKSSEKLSLSLTIAMFTTSLAWYTYGVLIDDLYVQLPSLQGVLSCLLQFFLIWKYPVSAKKIE
ncbi:sugar transporter SWEET1-like [Ptychodera flava]|uniref:sugar transporter SWEET1-like n=1 Tax=Ptychodera flava TaxID=63121 RepID=UPI00396A121F